MMGGIYALSAMSLNLIFGVMKILNFAHGVFMVLAMYITFWLFELFSLDPYLSIFVSFPLLFIVGVIIAKYLILPILKDPEENQILFTLGLLLFLENFALFLWGNDFRSVQVSYSGAIINLGDFILNLPRLFALGVAVVLLIGFYVFLKRTDLGKSIRAASDDLEGAFFAGINVKRVNIVTFGIGIGFAAVAGSVMMPFYQVSPHIATGWTVNAFIVVVLGGLGNFLGSLVGGLIVGVAESLGAVYMPGSLKEVMVFIIFILVLLLKPDGLLGKKG